NTAEQKFSRRSFACDGAARRASRKPDGRSRSGGRIARRYRKNARPEFACEHRHGRFEGIEKGRRERTSRVQSRYGKESVRRNDGANDTQTASRRKRRSAARAFLSLKSFECGRICAK